jgi:hypothetical protein
MGKIRVAKVVGYGSAIIGAVGGFLDAQSHPHLDYWAFVGVWIGAGAAIALLAIIPVALICIGWNAIADRISN